MASIYDRIAHAADLNELDSLRDEAYQNLASQIFWENQKKQTLWAVIQEKRNIDIENIGSDRSHIYGTHFHAKTHAKRITLPTIQLGSSNSKMVVEKLKKKSSQSACSFDQPQFQGSEGDIQGLAHDLLKDSVNICNILLETDERNRLFVRREAGIFSNFPDHSAVCVNDRKTPLLTVEDKRPHDKALKQGTSGDQMNSRVAGQGFDQMLKTVLFSLSDTAFGCVTTVHETRVLWIGQGADSFLKDMSSEGASGLFSEENLKHLGCLLRGLRKDGSETEQSASAGNVSTPPAKTVKPTPAIRDEASAIKSKVTSGRKAKKQKSEVVREVYHSQIFESNQLITLFCCLILGSIIVAKRDADAPDLNLRTPIDRNCLFFPVGTANAAPTIRYLNTISKGPWKKKYEKATPWKLLKPLDGFYVLDRIGEGATSKVYIAVDKEGYHCVLKLYVKEYTENGQRIPDFQTKAKTSVHLEAKRYRSLYPELQDYISAQQICNRWSLVLPHFTPLSDEQRGAPKTQKEIKQRYKEVFLEQGLCYAEEDCRWRHIGKFNDKLYLFDLGDLQKYILPEESKSGTAQTYIKTLIGRLHRNSLNAGNVVAVEDEEQEPGWRCVTM